MRRMVRTLRIEGPSLTESIEYKFSIQRVEYNQHGNQEEVVRGYDQVSYVHGLHSAISQS